MFNLYMYNPKEYDIWFAGYSYGCAHPLPGKSLKQWAIDEKADVVFNGTWFNMPTAANKKAGLEYNTVCYMRGKGEQIGYGGIYERIIIDSNNEVGGCYLGVKDNLLKFSDTASSRPRCGIGETADGRFFMAQSSKMTNKAFCQNVISWVKKYHNTTVKMFIVQDGGGSVGSYSTVAKSLWAPEKEGTNGRLVANVFCFKRKSTAPKVERTLKRGLKGDDVLLLQQTLTGTEADGVFGAGTQSRVKEIQKNLGLEADGIVGPATLKALKLK